MKEMNKQSDFLREYWIYSRDLFKILMFILVHNSTTVKWRIFRNFLKKFIVRLDSFKKGTYKEWFMPLWSLEELLEYRQLFYPSFSESVVNRLFEHWNGLIRYVISKPVNCITYKLDDDEIVAQVDEHFDYAINKSNIETLRHYIYGQDNVSDDVEISNKIILLNINTSTFEIEDLFMTDHARKRIIAQLHMK